MFQGVLDLSNPVSSTFPCRNSEWSFRWGQTGGCTQIDDTPDWSSTKHSWHDEPHRRKHKSKGGYPRHRYHSEQDRTWWGLINVSIAKRRPKSKRTDQHPACPFWNRVALVLALSGFQYTDRLRNSPTKLTIRYTCVAQRINLLFRIRVANYGRQCLAR